MCTAVKKKSYKRFLCRIPLSSSWFDSPTKSAQLLGSHTFRPCKRKSSKFVVSFVSQTNTQRQKHDLDGDNKLCGKPPQYATAPVTLTFDLLSFDLESVVRVTCYVGYLCAFSLPRPELCSRLRHDVRDRQTDVRRASSLNVTYHRGGDIIMDWKKTDFAVRFPSFSSTYSLDSLPSC